MHRQTHCTTLNRYAVRDRLDTSRLPDSPSLPDASAIRVEQILPTEEDHKVLLSNFAIMVCRVLKKHMPFFTKFGSGVERHIRHIYYAEMSTKSEVVSSTFHVYLHGIIVPTCK